MPNRFARRIRSGEIDRVEELKSEFKALAKATHPDLAGPGAAGGAFAALRGEYEDALRDFVSLRYGGPAADSGAALAFDRRALYADLARLLARGFPKSPRHDKERSRYERERFLVRSRLRAWNAAYPALLEAFEAAMLDLRASGSIERFDEALALLASVLEYHASGVAASRAVIAWDFARLRAWGEASGAAPGAGERRPTSAGGDELCDFLGILVEDLASGPAFA